MSRFVETGKSDRFVEGKSRRRFSPRAVAIVGTVAVILVALAAYLLGLSPGYAYSEGHRSGVVYKFSRKGVFRKTWEGELSLGLNEQDADGAVLPRIFEFSCTNDEIAAKLDAAERSGKRVSLHYKEYFGRGHWYGDTNYDIVGVDKSE